jgi:dTDP-4-amino-4,6-dideoxygalactose transaminase
VKIPFHRIRASRKTIAQEISSLRSGWWTCGALVARLEKIASEMTGGRYAVAVNSCAMALKICLQHRYLNAFRVGGGNGPAVLPAFGGHFFAQAWRDAVGGNFVLADCIPGTLSTMGQNALDYGGHPMKIVSEHSLIDAAYTFGAPSDNVSRGWARCYSFQAAKPLTSGEGGMIVTDDEALAIYANRFRSHGMDAASYNRTGLGDYDVVEDGGGYLMTDLSAALLLGQLNGHENERNRQRRIAIAREYDKVLPSGIRAVAIDEKNDNVGLYAVRVLGGRRDEFREFLSSREIQTRRHYAPVWEYTAFRRETESEIKHCPNAKQAADEVVTLPIFSDMTDEEVRSVTDAITEFGSQE